MTLEQEIQEKVKKGLKRAFSEASPEKIKSMSWFWRSHFRPYREKSATKERELELA